MSNFKNLVQILLTTIIGVTFFLGTAIAEKNSNKLVEKQKYEWVVEEILQQLTELRKEVSSMKSEVDALNVKLDKMAVKNVKAGAVAPSRVIPGEPILGDENASYAIVEFSDYQCPFCSRHANTVFPKIKQELIDTGKVQYTLRDYPLEFHKQAKGAAVAVRCAGEQGKYWDMHATLFNNTKTLNNEFYVSTAETMQLDQTEYSDCLNNPEIAKAVDQDFAYGNSLGVSGTPKFFVGKIKEGVITNVQVISGAQGFDAFTGAIERISKQGS